MIQTRTSPTALIRSRDGSWLSFRDPVFVAAAVEADEVRAVVRDVERMTRDRALHAVGFLTYEAGKAFGQPVRGEPARLPYAWFAFFEAAPAAPLPEPAAAGYELGPLAPSLDRTRFGAAFERVKAHLAAGDSYQANLTFKMRGGFSGDPRALFLDLVEAQRGAYAAFIDVGDWAICSASPELFFALDGLGVESRPMKGTARRGLTPDADQRQGESLQASAKQRAENVMIVDMMRNDLGRVADVGSVEVPALFSLERYPTVWQLTSTVTARSRASLEEIFAALHPSASVTGAPKFRTMQILAELETEPRGVYTGAIGHVPPDGNAQFNVAIRTAVVDRRAGEVEFGIGSGIVWDSEAEAEYAECLLKGQVLGRRPVRFELLETLRWTPDGGFLVLERHMERLAASAAYFGFRCEETIVRTALSEAVAGEVAPRRVRLLLGERGEVRVDTRELAARPGAARVALTADPIDPEQVWLYHKTTERQIYERAAAARPDCEDVILWNPAGEVTESTIANVVVEIDASRFTPPVSCGLLAGTFRAELLARGEIRERVITVEELRRAERFWLVNSVQEMRPATLVP